VLEVAFSIALALHAEERCEHALRDL